MKYWDSSAIVPLLVGDSCGADLPFVCCDERMQLAAEKEGLDVLRLIA